MDARQRFLWVFLASFVLATLIVFGTTMQGYVESSMRQGGGVNYWRMVTWPSVWWYGWVFIAPFCFEFVWRNPISRKKWARPLGYWILGGVFAFVAHLLIQIGAMYTPRFGDTHSTFAEVLEYHIVVSMYLNVFTYWCIVGGAHVARLYHTPIKGRLIQ